MNDYIVLVDENDKELGTEEKLSAHRMGLLHRAFSIFVFNRNGELLLQRRALSKYHCPGLWTNTCCSHPRPGETIGEAANRRLKEEMGFDCPLKEVFNFVYKTPVPPDLTEHEFDHVLVGTYEGPPVPNPVEVVECKWVRLDTLQADILAHPEKYTPWFRIIMEKCAKEGSKSSLGYFTADYTSRECGVFK